ncbi:C39 family peptidase [Paenibacillus thiaminolyticus]|uniref:C39 family peptidase n=1 Tax=Paenibacillus thiaminolyticus TaxID=49283 RepID=UPI003D2E9B26
MPQFVRRLNRWLLFLILLALCAFPIQFLFASKFKEGGLSFSFGMPTDDIVLMLHSNTAYVGRYLVPIDERENKASPYQQSGETLVPARFLASKLEAELAYDEAKGTITFTKDEARVTYRLNKPEVKIAGATSPVKTTPHVKDGLTYVPLRPVSEALGRNIYARDGLIALSKRDDAPNEAEWNDWRKELSQYIDYDTFGPYGVQLGGRFERVFRRWEDAVAYARQAPGRRVTYRGQHVMWDPEKPAPKSFRYNGAPLILQLPELPRGCEVTALAMLLKTADVDVDKMELAREIRRDPTPYKKTGGKVHFGNPHKGFVGDMYTFANPGLGVYHEPIAELAERYLPGRIADLTGTSIEHLLWIVGQGTPVWVIHTTMYDEVPDKYWVTWQTPDGPVRVTYFEHSFIVTGYDEKYVYINDPLGRRDRIERSAFQRGWEQMGSQAITYLPPEESVE